MATKKLSTKGAAMTAPKRHDWPTLDIEAIHAAGKLSFHSISHLLDAAVTWPGAAASALGLLGVLIQKNQPVPEPIRTFMVERLLAAADDPENIAKIFGLKSTTRGRRAQDDFCRNRRVVEIVSQLHRHNYALRIDAQRSAFVTASEVAISLGAPVSPDQVARIWKERNKYSV
jgi:hypothetical protein